MSIYKDYDRWHDRVFQSGPEHRDEDSPWYRLVLEYVAPVGGKRVLEVACGRGGLTKLLASRGAEVFGVDFSGVGLQIAQQRMQENEVQTGRISLAQADAQKLPFADRSFDLVISCETIEHVLDPLASLQEMARVCRPNGVLYLTTPNWFNLMGLYRVYDAILGRERRSEESQPYDTVWTFSKVRRLVRLAGWNVIRTDGTVHQVPVPGRAPVTLFFLERSRALRRVLSVFALHQFVMAKKKAS